MLSLDRVTTNDCPLDLNGDGFVDALDLGLLFEAWGQCAGSGCDEDLDLDGWVKFSDVLILLRAWGPCDGDEKGFAWKSKRDIRMHLKPHRRAKEENQSPLSLQRQWRLTSRALGKVRREHWRELRAERSRLREERRAARRNGHSVQD